MKTIFFAMLISSIAAPVSARSGSESDALSSFKQIVEKCAGIFRSTDGSVSAMADGRWSKNSRTDVQTKFDVKKTDSLVSPFTGTLTLSYLTLGATMHSESEARAAPLDPDGPAMKVSDVYHFAFRDGGWVGLGIDESRDLRTRAGRPFESLSTIKKDASRVSPQSLDGQCLRAGGRE